VRLTVRFLVGCADDISVASKTLLETLQWRKDEAVDFNEISRKTHFLLLMSIEHKFHFDMGKIYCNGTDKDGNPIIVMRVCFFVPISRLASP
jgi:hypothetical protein